MNLPLDGVAEEFFNENGIGNTEVWAEKFLEAKFIGVIRSMVRAHIQRVRMAANGGRLDKPFSPYGEWTPPDLEVVANMERMMEEDHDALLDV